PAADLVDVAHHAREQLTRAPAVVEGDGQVLDLLVEAHADLLLDGGRGGDGEGAAQPDQGGLDDAEAQYDRAAGPDGDGGGVAAEPVDDDLEDLRDHQRHERGRHGAEQAEEEADSDGTDRLPEAAHGAEHGGESSSEG